MFCYSEIGYFHVSIFIKHKIFWLYISMNYTILMDIFEGYGKTSNHEFRLILIKSYLLSDMKT